MIVDYVYLLAALTSLIAILIGWQIYNTIDINKRISDVEKFTSSTANKSIIKYNHTVQSFVYYLSSKDYQNRNIDEMSIDYLMKSIDEGMKGDYFMPIDFSLNDLYNICIRKDYFILKDKKKQYKKILQRIGNEKSLDIIDTLEDAKEI